MKDKIMVYDTVVIGGGQAGLAMGYYLKEQQRDFLIIDGEEQIGNSWRKRWDSLKLFTPKIHNQLPGLLNEFETSGRTSKNNMADYLESYAAKLKLPILLNTRVSRLDKTRSGYTLITTSGTINCKHVVIATGANHAAKIPPFAEELNKKIFQIHSSNYKNIASLPDGEVLIVGSAASGIEIALEIPVSRKPTLAGMPTTVLPAFLFKIGGLSWWIFKNILTIRNSLGRKMRIGYLKGGAVSPLLFARLDQSAVIRKPRVVRLNNGFPELENGEVVYPDIVIWCTGYQPDFSWINFYFKKENGWPIAPRGIVPDQKGLYFIGMPFQYNSTSSLVGGVGADAAYIAEHIKKSS